MDNLDTVAHEAAGAATDTGVDAVDDLGVKTDDGTKGELSAKAWIMFVSPTHRGLDVIRGVIVTQDIVR